MGVPGPSNVPLDINLREENDSESDIDLSNDLLISWGYQGRSHMEGGLRGGFKKYFFNSFLTKYLLNSQKNKKVCLSKFTPPPSRKIF